MIKSDLAGSIVPASENNYTQGRRGYKVCKFTPHHMAGVLTADQCGRIFQNSGRQASSNYGIGNDGSIACYVGEENRAWTSASSSNDCQAITVEVSNSSTGGQWPISDAAWNSLVKLAVDVCKRYNFRLIYDNTPNGSLTRHNMFANTNCPGATLQSRLPELAETVNRILDGNQPSPEPEPTPSTGRKVGDVVTINGVYTASNSTKKLNPSRTTGTITRIINGASNPYLLDNGNLGWVNDSVIVENSQPAPAPSKKSAEEVAKEILYSANYGDWGTGQERKDKLQTEGYDYNEVQGIINRLANGGSSNSNSQSTSINVGDRVRIKSSAQKYTTGQTIPNWVKNNTYTVMQISGNKSLLKEIMSWVYNSDLTK